MVINYTWDLPEPSLLWNKRVIRHVFDNWQISGITSFASGTPRGIGYSTIDNADITGGGDGARLVLTGNPILPRGERNIDRWFNTSAIALPARGDFGNAPKDVIRLPGTNNWDISLFKNIPLKGERTSLQLRWEIYNVFNHTQFSNVDTDAQFDASGVQVDERFGKVIEARSPRLMQFSLRFVF